MTDSLPSRRAPIFLISFNRPDYLRKVLESLRAQVDCEIDRRTIIMFQDGAVNPYSNERHASESDINQCVRIFYSLFPNSQVFRSPTNLGVAFNFDRAERYGFEELSAESVVFLEDDLVLSRHYLSIIDRLIEIFAEDRRVGYVAAYGDHTRSIKDQHTHRRRLIRLTHNWGFALYRRQWLKMRPHVLQYLGLVERKDYRYKDAQAIRDLFASWGFGCPAISQDGAKTIACCIDGVIKINTYVCNAKYIGSQGLHMNNKLYAGRGYDKTELYPDRVTDFAPLEAASYDALLRDQRAWAGKPATTVMEPANAPAAIESHNPAMAPDLEISTVADGYVVYQPDRDRVHYLNKTASLVFELCNGRNPEAEMPGLVQLAFGLSQPPVDEVAECLEVLRREGLISWSVSSPPRISARSANKASPRTAAAVSRSPSSMIRFSARSTVSDKSPIQSRRPERGIAQ
jgi:hypothetical protein